MIIMKREGGKEKRVEKRVIIMKREGEKEKRG